MAAVIDQTHQHAQNDLPRTGATIQRAPHHAVELFDCFVRHDIEGKENQRLQKFGGL